MSVLTADADSPCVEGNDHLSCRDPGSPSLLALLEMQRFLDGLSVVFTFCTLGTNIDVTDPKIDGSHLSLNLSK